MLVLRIQLIQGTQIAVTKITSSKPPKTRITHNLNTSCVRYHNPTSDAKKTRIMYNLNTLCPGHRDLTSEQD